MKITTILEDDLAARRAQKQQQSAAAAKNEVHEVLQDISDTVSASIDALERVGMSVEDAEKVVYRHLSDLVMANDIQ